MRVLAVANPKGGSGKSTLACHLAAALAWSGVQTMLGDIDQQQSSQLWLAQRPVNLPRIHGWEIKDGEPAKPPKGTNTAVLDTPASLHGKKLAQILKLADTLVVPVGASAFDRWASEAFFAELAEAKSVRKGSLQVLVVAMRVNTRATSYRDLEVFLQQHDFPVCTALRDTQGYVQVLNRGMTLFDLPRQKAALDRQQWQPLLDALGIA